MFCNKILNDGQDSFSINLGRLARFFHEKLSRRVRFFMIKKYSPFQGASRGRLQIAEGTQASRPRFFSVLLHFASLVSDIFRGHPLKGSNSTVLAKNWFNSPNFEYFWNFLFKNAIKVTFSTLFDCFFGMSFNSTNLKLFG